MIVLSDNDEKGMEHALEVADSVRRHAASVKNVWLCKSLDSEKEGFDVTDYLDIHTAQELIQLMGEELFLSATRSTEQSETQDLAI